MIEWLVMSIVIVGFSVSIVWIGKYLYPIVLLGQKMKNCYKAKGYSFPPEDWS